MSEIWFTSDTHFGHVRIAEFCPTRISEFGMSASDDVATMNAAMVEQWNSQVAPGDEVYHLGDLAMGNIENSLSYVAQLNGIITLIWGNHDRPHPSYSRDHDKRMAWVQRYADAGMHVQRMDDRMEVDGVPVWMSHFPYTGDSDEHDRYPEYRPEDHGQVLVHGHIHDLWQINGRQVNVGVDAHGGRLLHYDEVSEFVAQAAVN